MNSLYLNHNGFFEFCKGYGESKTKTFPFNFLRLPPAPPAVLKGKGRKFYGFVSAASFLQKGLLSNYGKVALFRPSISASFASGEALPIGVWC